MNTTLQRQNALHVQRAVMGIQQQYYLLTQLIERLPIEVVDALAFAYDLKKVGSTEP